jgi:hypothetical protein
MRGAFTLPALRTGRHSPAEDRAALMIVERGGMLG